jgi:hypothetical protein
MAASATFGRANDPRGQARHPAGCHSESPMPVARSRSTASRCAAPTSFPGASRRLCGADAVKWLGDPKRPSSASVYLAGGNTGGNEVGTNRVRGWLLVSAHVTSKMASLQAIARGHRRFGWLGRPPTEPKVRGSNPLGRVKERALVSQVLAELRHRRVGTGGNETGASPAWVTGCAPTQGAGRVVHGFRTCGSITETPAR